MSNQLEGKVAIVTGAGDVDSIGAAYARGLAEQGASVVVADINSAGAAAVATALSAEGLAVSDAEVDVTSPASAAAMVELATERYGGVDILVNNAAMMSEIKHGKLADIPIDVWDQINRVNVTGVLICSQAVIPSMRSRGGGRIINQSSAAAFMAGGVYRTSKHGVVSLTAGLGTELGPENIFVNAIAPGLIRSSAGLKVAPADSDKRQNYVDNIPHPSPDRPPKDLVATLLLLAGPGGDYINGQTINVDGGWVTRL